MQIWLNRILNALAAVASFGVLGWGVYSLWSIDFRMNPVLSILYCALPVLPFCLVARVRRGHVSAWWLSAAASAYLVVYSMLNWRTCSAHGYCGSVERTICLTLETPSMLGFIVAAACCLGAEAIRTRAGVGKPPETQSQEIATPAR
jgi:hypothetical protein